MVRLSAAQMELMGALFLAVLLPLIMGDLGYNITSTGDNNAGKNEVSNTEQKFVASDLQSVFADTSCIDCIKCMERAITAHKITNNVMQMKNAEVLNHLNEELQREKRKTVDIRNIDITKYYAHGKLYALKVKDNVDNINTKEYKCDLYKIEYFHPCNTTNANLILTESKKHT